MTDVRTLVERRCAVPDDWKEEYKDDVDVERRRAANNGHDGSEEDQVLFTKGAAVPMEQVDWHWKGWLAYGISPISGRQRRG